MTTFIFRDGVLTADRLKITNLPGFKPIVSSKETKLIRNDWCAYALSGDEPWPQRVVQLLHLVSISASIDLLNKLCTALRHKAADENDKNYEAIYNNTFKIAAMSDSLMEELSEYSQLDGGKKVARGVVMTHRHFYVNGDDGFTDVRSGLPAVHGAGYSTAELLITLNVPTEKIYRHLANVGIPTGKDYDSFKQSDLPDLEAPLCDAQLNLTIFRILNANIEASPNKERQNLKPLLVLLACLRVRKKVTHTGEEQRFNNFNEASFYNFLASKYDEIEHYDDYKKFVDIHFTDDKK